MPAETRFVSKQSVAQPESDILQTTALQGQQGEPGPVHGPRSITMLIWTYERLYATLVWVVNMKHMTFYGNLGIWWLM